MVSAAEQEARERIARYNRGKAEWAEVKAARAAGLPDPDTPNLDAMAARMPVVTAMGQALEGQAEERAASRSAAAKKAWETRRRNAERQAAS